MNLTSLQLYLRCDEESQMKVRDLLVALADPAIDQIEKRRVLANISAVLGEGKGRNIRFKVHPRITEDVVVNRMAQLVGFTPHCPPFIQQSGYKWQLNDSNNWWLDFDKQTGEYIFAGRYATQELLEAYVTVLDWDLGMR